MTETAEAKRLWDADRAMLLVEHPEWEMPAWSRAPPGRRPPYLLAAAKDVTNAE